eukprot:1555035-Prymnesium_polylepis.1
MLILPHPATIPMTNAEGQNVSRTVPAAGDVPEHFVQADDTSDWANGPEWVQLVTFGDLCGNAARPTCLRLASC